LTSIEFLGHAGLAFRSGGELLLCAPWLSPHGAYNASWFQYPRYRKDLEPLLHPDAIYVSHEHLDHFDPWFLAKIDRSTPILTGRFQKKRLLRELRNLGFRNIVELDGFDAYPVAADLKVRISTATYKCPPHWFDSCCIVETDGHKFFNLNDCNLALPVERIRDEGIDVLFGQASPAIWYPLTYTGYSRTRLAELKRARRSSALESFITAVEAIEPKLAIPFAGPPIFFDPQLADFFIGPESMFPTPPVAVEELSRHGSWPALVMKPGDRLCFEGGAPARLEPDPEYLSFDYETGRNAYFERNAAEIQPIVRAVNDAVPVPAAGLFERLRDHLSPLIKNNPYFAAHINIRVLFDVSGPQGGRWIADFRDGAPDIVVYADDGGGTEYKFELESKYLDQVLRGELSWEDLFLSLRFRAHRDPDIYNQHLFTFFKMGDHASLQAIAKAEMEIASGDPEDTFVLEAEGNSYLVQRFCPHAGSDLTCAKVQDGHIVCPGHQWKFSLETGVCRHSNARLFIRRRSGPA